MKKVLLINSCVYSGHQSRTLEICRDFVDALEGYETEELVVDENIIPMNEARLEQRNALVENSDYSSDMFSLARQLADCDMVVIACPYWDMSFPAVLKSYIENIMVAGLTFELTEKGYKGLCKAENFIYITTAGGYIGENNFGYDYIKACMKMLGIENSSLITAEGLDIYGNDVNQILSKAKENAIAKAKNY